MAGWQEFAGLNRGYVLELYEKYRNDPASVDAETRAVFEQWTPPAESAAVPDGLAYDKIVGKLPLTTVPFRPITLVVDVLKYYKGRNARKTSPCALTVSVA